MARGRKSTPQHTIRQCFILQGELKTYSAIGRALELAPNTVKSILLNETYIAKYGDLMQEIAKIEKDSNLEIIELVKSNRYSKIANDIVGLFTIENLTKEMGISGIRNLTNLLGNTVDKTMAIKKLDIDEKRLELQIRTLELKEKELNARLDNPEAFAVVQIINDAPMKEAPYGTN